MPPMRPQPSSRNAQLAAQRAAQRAQWQALQAGRQGPVPPAGRRTSLPTRILLGLVGLVIGLAVLAGVVIVVVSALAQARG
jgi:hypothetical protein